MTREEMFKVVCQWDELCDGCPMHNEDNPHIRALFDFWYGRFVRRAEGCAIVSDWDEATTDAKVLEWMKPFILEFAWMKCEDCEEFSKILTENYQ